MGISRQEFERRYRAIRALMQRDGLDCLLVAGLPDDFNRGNIRYITGSGRGGCCLFPVEGVPVFLTGPGQAAAPKNRKTIEALDLLRLSETTDAAEQAAAELSRMYRGGKVGIVGMGLVTVPMYLNVKGKFGDKLTDAAGIFEQVRAVKSQEEIEKMRIAARVADKVFEVLVDMLRPGLSDYSVYAAVKKTIYEMGCDYSFDLIDAEGARMNMTFFPTGERLKAQSTLFVEITPAFEGYYAQLPVTLPIGKYPPEIRKMVFVWEEANRAALDILHPGTKVSDLYRTLVSIVQQHGYVSPLRPGHAIGLDALDFWSITGNSPVILQAGMTLAVHPSIMTRPGADACGLGYTYLITGTGAERFSKVELAGLVA
ncbi:MAG: hypothetical protein A2Z29_06680 [Chloroflexi bacterium RBG_16_56_11]|nr:MAG: hypothetical protein A2Z29_06680 [Chloroflexi bacterium RBG_16_56_11]